MAVYRRGKTWWYEFVWNGNRIRESAGRGSSKTQAKAAEEARKVALRDGGALARRRPPTLLRAAARDWLTIKEASLAPRSIIIEQANLKHILPALGNKVTTEIDAAAVAAYQTARTKAGAAPKTVNLEVGTLRAILRRLGLWAALAPEVKMLPVSDDVGRAISREEERKLLGECSRSRSLALFPAVVVSLYSGVRFHELVGLRWSQVDLKQKTLRVGKSKTAAGAGRPVPLTPEAYGALAQWAHRFPKRTRDHYVFPAEHYSSKGAYGTTPAEPIDSLRAAWRGARDRARIKIRWHDLRHTFATRLLEAGTAFPMVGLLCGWSPGTTVRMAKRYGHVSVEALRSAVNRISRPGKRTRPPQTSPQTRKSSSRKSRAAETKNAANSLN